MASSKRPLHLDIELRRSAGRHVDVARVGLGKITTGHIQVVSAFRHVEEVHLALIVRRAFGHGTTVSDQGDVGKRVTASAPKGNPHSDPPDDVARVDLRRNRTCKQKEDNKHATLPLSRTRSLPVTGEDEGSCDNLGSETYSQKIR
jgi:hypothetical protein